jgi:CRISPR/Cas system CMR subunit Cmr4 (Cas7 group RAMP superfamily)
LKRNEKSAGKKNRKPKVENKSLSGKHSTRKKNSTINSAQSSNGSFNNKDDKKQREENEINVKPANSIILKPITLKLDEKNESVVKAKEIIQSKTESRENSQDLRKQRKAVVAHEDAKMKKHVLLRSEENIQAKNSEFAKISKEKIPDGELKVDDKVMSEDGNGKMSARGDRGTDEERFSNRSLKYDPKECKYRCK